VSCVVQRRRASGMADSGPEVVEQFKTFFFFFFFFFFS
jgi:hypothetical protein